MVTAIANLTSALKQARQRSHLSQRALGRKVGMPQAQISKIENAAVDPKVSTLVVLAQAVDLELTLVPRTGSAVLEVMDFPHPSPKEGLSPR
jgi:transcriptional regulator with XRE-family HTH domain